VGRVVVRCIVIAASSVGRCSDTGRRLTGEPDVIDWLTLKLPESYLPRDVALRVQHRAGEVVAISADGEVVWRKHLWEPVRSDIGQVLCRLGDGLEVMGSPARACGGDNAFGTGDPREAAESMVALVSSVLDYELPRDWSLWRLTRLDITHSYHLGGASEVRAALDSLRYAEGGRYRGRSAGSTLYWGVKSAHRSGKAYAKGQHLRFLASKNEVELEPWQFEAADGLLRLELALRRHWWDRAEKSWYEFREEELDTVHAEYFKPLIGDVKVEVMERKLIESLTAVCGSEGKAKAAFRTWALIKQVGVEQARDSMPKSTFNRHTKHLRAVGLSYADLRASNVLPFRRRTIELGAPVRSWDELRRVA